LEAACARALQFQDTRYRTIKRILSQGLDQAPPPPAPAPAVPAKTFIRNAGELLGHLFGGVTWN
jgi:hypothetical protein